MDTMYNKQTRSQGALSWIPYGFRGKNTKQGFVSVQKSQNKPTRRFVSFLFSINVATGYIPYGPDLLSVSVIDRFRARRVKLPCVSPRSSICVK